MSSENSESRLSYWDRFPLWAGERPERSRDTCAVRGKPQMGAVVEFSAPPITLTVFTDGAGYYAATGLLPGLYTLKVTAPSFFPALREKVGLRSGGSVNVNVTLSTLLGVMQSGPSVAFLTTMIGSGRCVRWPTGPFCVCLTIPAWWFREDKSSHDVSWHGLIPDGLSRQRHRTNRRARALPLSVRFSPTEKWRFGGDRSLRLRLAGGRVPRQLLASDVGWF